MGMPRLATRPRALATRKADDARQASSRSAGRAAAGEHLLSRRAIVAQLPQKSSDFRLNSSTTVHHRDSRKGEGECVHAC